MNIEEAIHWIKLSNHCETIPSEAIAIAVNAMHLLTENNRVCRSVFENPDLSAIEARDDFLKDDNSYRDEFGVLTIPIERSVIN